MLVSNKLLYSDNGIYLSKPKLYAGEQEEILYNGLLARSGADRVYVYIGYGEEWEEEEYIGMVESQDGFKASFTAKAPGSLNLCFKDSANNWDNNSGQNYRFDVLKKKATVKAAKEANEPRAKEAKEPKVKETKELKEKETKEPKVKETKELKAKEAKKINKKERSGDDTKAGRGKTARSK